MIELCSDWNVCIDGCLNDWVIGGRVISPSGIWRSDVWTWDTCSVAQSLMAYFLLVSFYGWSFFLSYSGPVCCYFVKAKINKGSQWQMAGERVGQRRKRDAVFVLFCFLTFMWWFPCRPFWIQANKSPSFFISSPLFVRSSDFNPFSHRYGLTLISIPSDIWQRTVVSVGFRSRRSLER